MTAHSYFRYPRYQQHPSTPYSFFVYTLYASDSGLATTCNDDTILRGPICSAVIRAVWTIQLTLLSHDEQSKTLLWNSIQPLLKHADRTRKLERDELLPARGKEKEGDLRQADLPRQRRTCKREKMKEERVEQKTHRGIRLVHRGLCSPSARPPTHPEPVHAYMQSW